MGWNKREKTNFMLKEQNIPKAVYPEIVLYVLDINISNVGDILQVNEALQVAIDPVWNKIILFHLNKCIETIVV